MSKLPPYREYAQKVVGGHYKVLGEEDIQKLEMIVNDYCRMGFVPVGRVWVEEGLADTTSYNTGVIKKRYYQSMFKKPEPEEKE